MSRPTDHRPTRTRSGSPRRARVARRRIPAALVSGALLATGLSLLPVPAAHAGVTNFTATTWSDPTAGATDGLVQAFADPACASGCIVNLGQDINDPTSSYTQLAVPTGSTVTLDLHGHNLTIGATGSAIPAGDAGIGVPAAATTGGTPATLTVQDSNPGTNSLTVTGGGNSDDSVIGQGGAGAAIGGNAEQAGGNVNIKSGRVNATGGSNNNTSGSGNAGSGGGAGAGVGSGGGGFSHPSASGATVLVTGGTLDALGGTNADTTNKAGDTSGGVARSDGGAGAGIGSGGGGGRAASGSGGTLRVIGGTVNATGGDNAGLANSTGSPGSYRSRGGAGAGFGSGGGGVDGNSGSGGTLTVSGGTLNAVGGTNTNVNTQGTSSTSAQSAGGAGSGIGSGGSGGDDGLPNAHTLASGPGGTSTVTGGTVNAIGGRNTADNASAGDGGPGTGIGSGGSGGFAGSGTNVGTYTTGAGGVLGVGTPAVLGSVTNTNGTGGAGTAGQDAAEYALALTTSSSATTYGQPVTLSATFTSVPGTSPAACDSPTITFAYTTTAGGAPTPLTGTPTNSPPGHVQLTTTALPPGSDTPIATLTGAATGSCAAGAATLDNLLTAAADPVTVTAVSAATKTTLSVNPPTGPYRYGAPGNTVIATVVTNPLGGSTPTGTVQFTDTVNGSTSNLGGPVGLNSSGHATLGLAILTAGPHSIGASYHPDSADYQTSTATAVNVTISKATPTVKLSASPDPSAFLQSVALAATLTGPVPCTTGTVAFTSGGHNLGSAGTSNGIASITTSALPLGADPITATYTPSSSAAANCTTATGSTVHQVNLINITLGTGGTSLTITLPLGITVGPLPLAAHRNWTCKATGDGKNQTCIRDLGHKVRTGEKLPDIDIPVTVTTEHGPDTWHAKLAGPTAPDKPSPTSLKVTRT